MTITSPPQARLAAAAADPAATPTVPARGTAPGPVDPQAPPIYLIPTLIGALAVRWIVGSDIHDVDRFSFAAVVVLVFLVTNAINFAFIAAGTAYGYGIPVPVMLRSFVTALPAEFATALLTAE